MKCLTPALKKELYPENPVFVAYRGSVAHGMYIPNTDPGSVDDIDLMGVYLAPREYYIGLGNPLEFNDDNTIKVDHRKSIEKFIGEYDVVSYELRKFVNLLLKSNPNVLGTLWLKDPHYLYMTEAALTLIHNRDLFVSKYVYVPFTQYANEQLKKMTAFSKKGYMGQKRKNLVDKYGYDCKNAAHCIRLLKMCLECLETGAFNVFREHDADWLLSIKRGEWALEEVKKEAKHLFELNKNAFAKSSLPEKPNYAKVEELITNIIFDYISNE